MALIHELRQLVQQETGPLGRIMAELIRLHDLIGSTAGLDGQGGPYATAKAALHGYARDLARRAGKRRITANAIAPGFVADTEFFEAGGYGDSSTMVDQVAARTLVGRVGKPDDITACAEWLLSPRAGWVTGQTISVNGGVLML